MCVLLIGGYLGAGRSALASSEPPADQAQNDVVFAYNVETPERQSEELNKRVERVGPLSKGKVEGQRAGICF